MLTVILNRKDCQAENETHYYTSYDSGSAEYYDGAIDDYTKAVNPGGSSEGEENMFDADENSYDERDFDVDNYHRDGWYWD